jgi:hypothetical protein
MGGVSGISDDLRNAVECASSESTLALALREGAAQDAHVLKTHQGAANCIGAPLRGIGEQAVSKTRLKRSFRRRFLEI